ncbi:bifunctional serine/threonine-protein kinase/ABC transporter substrate-binding protein [Streptomyces sp. 4N509B]|uniref:bifunctional serine/threonine-protein kinase/ABC transporter substrate-binding protein n=1 Tax=Streptomyces sp. 4N509B TaxID=3457413 RepID=UPI003FD06F8F
MAPFQALQAGDPERVGRYQVVGRLGAGAMGRVYLARSPGGRPVAVKVIRVEQAEDPDFRRRFVREVAAVRRVNSFFTAGVVDADPEGTPPWLATAYVSGLPLGEAIAAHGPWPDPSVRALGAALAEALEAIHAAGVVHRDLKPSNVLLASDGPRVIDFGVSLAVGGIPLTRTGAIVGTPGFIAPEQLRGAGGSPASDVFALGAVLAYAATGTGPFGSGLVHEVNFRVAYEPAELGGVSEGLRELLSWCLEKDPELRPGVAELVERLGGDARGLTTLDWLPEAVARSVRERNEVPLPAVPPPPSARGPSRRRALAIAGGAAGVAGLGALTYALTAFGDGDGGDSDSGEGGGSDAEPRTVRIAVQGPLTGDNSALGRDMVAAVRLAVDQANQSGDHPDLRFEVVEADDHGADDTAIAAAQATIDDGRVLAVVGPAYSSAAQAAGPLYSAAGLTAVTPLATSPRLAENTPSTLLRGVPDDRQAGEAIGDLLAGVASVVVDDASAHGVALADAVAERLGVSAPYTRRSVPPFDEVARAVREANAGTVVFCGAVERAGDLAFALRAEGYTGNVVGGEGVMGRSLLTTWRDVSEGWYLVSHRFDPSVSEEGRRFARLFEETNDVRPGHYSARTFDVATLIIEAVAGLDGRADREAVFEAVAGHRLQGVTGRIAFDADGEYDGDGPQLFQVRDGVFVPLGPVEGYAYAP